MDEQANHVFCIVAFQETQIFSFCAHCWVCLPSRSVSLWGKRLYENDTAMWHGDHLFPHSLGRVMSHPIMVHQHWELSRPWRTEMNLDVVIRSGISFNRLHFMVMWPVPLSLNVHLSSEPHTHIIEHTNTQSQKNTHLPTHSHQDSICPHHFITVYYSVSHLSLHHNITLWCLPSALHLCLFSDGIWRLPKWYVCLPWH